MSKQNFKILSLDGGGYKGLCTIACIAEIENKLDLKFCDYFDMFAGTSTGSIIAMGLATGHTASEILDLYKNIGPKVFPCKIPFIGKKLQFIKQIFYSKFSNKQLKKSLREFFGDIKVENVLERNKYIIIPTLCLSNGQPRIFKTDYKNGELDQHNNYDVVDIIIASCSAPTYFPAAKIKNPNTNIYEYFVDGGMFANNPSVCALVEAISNISTNKENVKLLSIAPPSEKLILKDKNILPIEYKGVLGWNKNLISMALEGTSLRDAYISKFLLDKANYLRLKPSPTPNTPSELDSCNNNDINELERLGRDLVINDFMNIKKFFNGANNETDTRIKENMEVTNG